jgi:hypothetical protein
MHQLQCADRNEAFQSNENVNDLLEIIKSSSSVKNDGPVINGIIGYCEGKSGL